MHIRRVSWGTLAALPLLPFPILLSSPSHGYFQSWNQQEYGRLWTLRLKSIVSVDRQASEDFALVMAIGDLWKKSVSMSLKGLWWAGRSCSKAIVLPKLIGQKHRWSLSGIPKFNTCPRKSLDSCTYYAAFYQNSDYPLTTEKIPPRVTS